MGRRTARRLVTRVRGAEVDRRPDTLAVEEPLEIRVDGEPFTVTMRTPGEDVELAHGLLRSEGVIRTREDVRTARFCSDTGELNVLDIALTVAGGPALSSQRTLAAYGGCGLCGSSTIDAVTDRLGGTPVPVATSVTPTAVHRALDGLREAQSVFERTGGTHGAALAGAAGEVVHVREDVGRHNAVDKVLGAVIIDGAESPPPLLVVSSRASFEIVAKAAMSGVEVLACVSAASSLAVDAAEQLGLTLVAFARGDRLTVCSHPERIDDI
ncbi:formate dehydrogenase accessory sulfurtransferase FdhD [Marihabitans asiaticum]|uniref:Sulfur carrier protein FdhD n=1 Tax=Marihabitans asiaticum TaxID=415218 RepID=A0A560W6Q0_9MICO|nr:formate dehydrogenase accessory sulfurtransferase FdhD [Marihabitans asiaticum]TWD13296.1 FdhD protein [Marihabitans asiaticum]